jgi:hypothetical protein
MSFKLLRTLSITSALLLATSPGSSIGQESRTRKHVFTNDDLQKYSEKYGSDPQPVQSTAAGPADTQARGKLTETSSPAAEKPSEKSLWVSKLKKADDDLVKFKAAETKFATAMDKFRVNFAEAKSDFHRQTALLQIADSEKNLAWAKEELKKAEEEKKKVLSEAAKKGLKPEDLAAGERQDSAPQALITSK